MKFTSKYIPKVFLLYSSIGNSDADIISIIALPILFLSLDLLLEINLTIKFEKSALNKGILLKLFESKNIKPI